MNIQDLKRLLNIKADVDSDGETLVLFASDGKDFSLSYKVQGSSVTTSLPYKGKKFLVQMELVQVQCAIAEYKNLDEVKFFEEQGDLTLEITRDKEKIATIQLLSSLKSEVAMPANDFLADHELVLDSRQWKMIEQVAKIILDHEREIEGLEVFVVGTTLTVKGVAKEFICQKSFELSQRETTQRFVLPIGMVDLARIFKPSGIKIRANPNQILLDLGETRIVSDPMNADFPATDGLFESDPSKEIKATLDRKPLLDFVQELADAGAKKITVIFGNQNITIKGAQQEKVIETSISNPVKTTITVATNILLAVLGSISNAKVIFLLPFAGASSLIVELLSGLVFVVAVGAKKLKQAVDSTLELAAKLEPEKEVLQVGRNSDGSTYAIEAVEQLPLPNGSSKEYLKQLREVVTQIDGEITTLESNLSGEHLPERSQELMARKSQLMQIKESINNLLDGLILKTQPHTEVVAVEESYSLADLEGIRVRLQWAYHRVLEIAFCKEKEWRFYIRLFKTA